MDPSSFPLFSLLESILSGIARLCNSEGQFSLGRQLAVHPGLRLAEAYAAHLAGQLTAQLQHVSGHTWRLNRAS